MFSPSWKGWRHAQADRGRRIVLGGRRLLTTRRSRYVEGQGDRQESRATAIRLARRLARRGQAAQRGEWRAGVQEVRSRIAHGQEDPSRRFAGVLRLQ